MRTLFRINMVPEQKEYERTDKRVDEYCAAVAAELVDSALRMLPVVYCLRDR